MRIQLCNSNAGIQLCAGNAGILLCPGDVPASCPCDPWPGAYPWDAEDEPCAGLYDEYDISGTIEKREAIGDCSGSILETIDFSVTVQATSTSCKWEVTTGDTALKEVRYVVLQLNFTEWYVGLDIAFQVEGRTIVHAPYSTADCGLVPTYNQCYTTGCDSSGHDVTISNLSVDEAAP